MSGEFAFGGDQSRERMYLVPSRRLSVRQTPYVSEAVDEYLRWQHSMLKASSFRTHQSLLRGSSRAHAGGRAQMGTPMAKSHLGNRRVGSLTREDAAEWFAQRCPPHMSNNARRRNSVIFGQWLKFCLEKGWLDPDVLRARQRLKHEKPARQWLRPHQLREYTRAFSLLREREPWLYDEMREWIWDCGLSTGMRAAEIVDAQPEDLDLHSLVVTVNGKGSGQGKTRHIRVTREFAQRWEDHALTHRLRNGQYMVYRRDFVSHGGAEQRVGEWVTVSKSEPASTASLREFTARLFDDVEQMIEEGVLDPKLIPVWRLSPKVLRKTFACMQMILHELNLGGMSLLALERALGHEDIRTVRSYLPEVEDYLSQFERRVDAEQAAGAILETLDQRHGDVA